MTDGTGPRITVSKDGPYVIGGSVPLTRQIIVTDENGESVGWKEAERFSERGSRALCRCGESSVKPYCDGSHRSSGFDGTETAPHVAYGDAAIAIEGSGIVLLDESDLCAEARFCAAKGAIWHRVLDAGDDSRTAVVEQSQLCPSGRYTAVDKGSGSVYEPLIEPSIGVVEDPAAGVSGPLWVRGGMPVVSASGEEYEVRNRVTLCRCGESKNKPFCDSTHIEIGFDDGE